jgi:DNA-binding NtrC family response regulator
MQPVIVYVDDEANNLTVFDAICAASWSVHCFDNPLSALARMKELNPWVIVSDQRMPSMKGVEFLTLAAQLVPLAVRIIVTGYSDEDLVISSVTRAQVFDYIKKPWEPELLEKSLERPSNTIGSTARKRKSLPILPINGRSWSVRRVIWKKPVWNSSWLGTANQKCAASWNAGCHPLCFGPCKILS